MSNNDVISSNDPQALEKLAEKKQRCVDTQGIMKGIKGAFKFYW